MKNTGYILIFLIGSLTFSACTDESANENPSEQSEKSGRVNIPFREDGSLTMIRDGEIFHELKIEIAESDSARTRGLMQRDGLPTDTGMLFLFSDETQQGFWMANTRIALDLIFILSDGTVLSISKYVQPMRTETISSLGQAQYVLEVEAGVTDSIGLIEGDLIQWTEN